MEWLMLQRKTSMWKHWDCSHTTKDTDGEVSRRCTSSCLVPAWFNKFVNLYLYISLFLTCFFHDSHEHHCWAMCAMFLDLLTDGVAQIPAMSPWSERNKTLPAIAHSWDMFVFKVKALFCAILLQAWLTDIPNFFLFLCFLLVWKLAWPTYC